MPERGRDHLLVPPSNGEGDTRPAPSRRPPPLPRSKGEGDTASCAFAGRLPLLQAVDAHQACLFRAQTVTAKRLTRAPLLHRAGHTTTVFREDQAWSLRPAIRARWTCLRSRRRAASLARGSTSRRRNILWIFAFDSLFQFRLC